MEQQEKEKAQGCLAVFGWIVFVFAVKSRYFFDYILMPKPKDAS
jgi:hypothetical protein